VSSRIVRTNHPAQFQRARYEKKAAPGTPEAALHCQRALQRSAASSWLPVLPPPGIRAAESPYGWPARRRRRGQPQNRPAAVCASR
jgi:hypothetical protein